MEVRHLLICAAMQNQKDFVEKKLAEMEKKKGKLAICNLEYLRGQELFLPRPYLSAECIFFSQALVYNFEGNYEN